MTQYADLEHAAAAHCLAVFGAFHPVPDDDLPGSKTLVMFGPAEPGFWPHITATPEWRDGVADPIDRWSKRVLGEIAVAWGGTAFFPSDGPPYPPFIRWALRTGRVWASPVQLLVHDRAGLMVSFRGALALPERIALPEPPKASPCCTCADQPCLSACPVSALTGTGYDVTACHAFLDRVEGQSCLSSGCVARSTCPVSQAYGRLPEHSSYHMRLFHT